MSALLERAESLLYDLGALKNEGVPTPERFKAVGRHIAEDARPKEVQVIRFDDEMYPKPKGDRVSLIPVNDIHYGSLSCNREKFEEYLDYILQTPDTYATGVGDLIENATKSSVGMAMYEESNHLPEQMEYIADRLTPLVKAGKFFGVQPGNHEYRTSVLIGMDPMQIIAKWLGIPYLGWQAYWLFDVAGEQYKGLTYHGASGSATKGGKINAVRKLNQITPDADFYVMGHVHDIQYDFDVYYTIDTVSGQLVKRKRNYVIAGSLLSYFGGYAEMAAYAPSPMGLVRMDFLKDRHDIQVHF